MAGRRHEATRHSFGAAFVRSRVIEPATRRRGALEQRLESASVTIAKQLPSLVERRTITVELFEQRVTVCQCDVTPHLRRASRDTREIAKTRSSALEQRVAVCSRGKFIDEDERQHMRKMRHRRKCVIVIKR